MTAANSIRRRFGATEYPLPTAASVDFDHLDPAGGILLDLFAAAINDELGEAWPTVAAGPGPLYGSKPVQSKLNASPDLEALRQVKLTFPILCVSRSEDQVQVEDYSFDRDMLTGRWDVDYILGPLELGTQLSIDPVLRAVGQIIIAVVREGGHRAYRSYETQGYTFASNVMAHGPDCCGFSAVRVVDYRAGAAQPLGTATKFFACSVTLETVELSDWLRSPSVDGKPGEVVGESGPYLGTSVTLNTGNQDGTLPVVVAKS